MKTASTIARAPRPRRRAHVLCVALVLAALVAAPARAGTPAIPSPPLAGVSSRSIWAPLEWALGSQRRMLQVATVGMCLALYIMMWRK